MTTTKRSRKKAGSEQPETEVAPVALEVEPTSTESERTSTSLDDLINRAGGKAVTQEEVNFVTSARQRFDLGQPLSAFDGNWLHELARR